MVTRSVVVGVFDDKRQAQRAVDQLRQAGFTDDRVGVMARDGDVRKDLEQAPRNNESYAGEGAVIGAAGGAGGGVLWGLGIAAGALPAIGPVIAGGTFAAVLASAVVAGAAGGLVGALVGWGMPEEEAREYETDVHAGRIVVAVRADGRAREASDLLATHGARVQPPVAVVR